MSATQAPRRKRRWPFVAGLLAIIVIAAIGFAVIRHQFTHPPAPTASNGPIGPAGGTATSADHRTSLTVAAGTVSTPVSVAFAQADTKTEATPMDGLVQPIGQPVTVRVTSALRQAELALVVLPSDLPRPDPGRPQATLQNVGIQVYDTALGIWTPLASHVEAGRGLVKAMVTGLAAATYRLVAAKIGSYTLEAGRTIRVNYGVSVTPADLFGAVAQGAVTAVLAAATQPLASDKYNCVSPSRRFEVFTRTANVKVDICVVNAEGSTQLRVKNTNQTPFRLNYDPADGIGVALNQSADFPELTNQFASLLQGRPLSYGPGVAAVGLGSTAPATTGLSVETSWAPLADDLTGTMLSVWLPAGKTAAYRRVLVGQRQRFNAALVRNRHQSFDLKGLQAGLDPSTTSGRQAGLVITTLACSAPAGQALKAKDWPETLAQLLQISRTCLGRTGIAGSDAQPQAPATPVFPVSPNYRLAAVTVSRS